jgi:transcriptional regulator with XRE-family HTH domain
MCHVTVTCQGQLSLDFPQFADNSCPVTSPLGDLIATKRDAKGLRQEDLAPLLKVSDRTVKRWEAGRVRFFYLPRLVELLEINAMELATALAAGESRRGSGEVPDVLEVLELQEQQGRDLERLSKRVAALARQQKRLASGNE